MVGKHSRPQSLRSFKPAVGIERLWEQPFQACAIDEDFVKPDGQNSVISFVISKWLFPELSIPAAGQKDRRLWGREWVGKLVIFDWFVLSMRMQVILDSLFARPGSAPIWGAKKGEFRDWTSAGSAVACERRRISGCHWFGGTSDSRKYVCVRRLGVPGVELVFM